MTRTWLLLPLALVFSSGAFAQGNDSTSLSSEGDEQQEAAIQIGAGATTAATTTGSSGPQSGAGGDDDESPQPLDPGFALVPAQDEFWGPAQLAWQRPASLRCDLIADANARAHCETYGPKFVLGER